ICQAEVKGICYAILIFVQCILRLRSMFILNMAKVSNNKSQNLIVQTTLNTRFPTMEHSPHVYIPEFGGSEEIGEEEEEEIYQVDSNMEPDMMRSHYQVERDGSSFPCQHCEGQFACKQALEKHMEVHALANDEAHLNKNNANKLSFPSNISQLPHEKSNTLDSEDSVTQLHTSSTTASSTSLLSAGDLTDQPHTSEVSEGHHACKYCEKIFTTHTNKRRHERRVHENQLHVTHVEKAQLPQEENLHRTVSESSQQQTQLGDNTPPAAVVENEGEHEEHYMLDVSSNISENLSFYIDGKIVSTSTVSNCEAAEVHSGSSTLVGLDALILDPAHISQVLNADSVISKEIPGQPLAKRRTATPPLLPQIKTELESEVVVSSSSSSLVSSLIENLLPQNTESTVVQKERTVFLSPKLKQLLEKQDGLKPTLALITDGQKPCSPVSISVLPSGTGKFKRRTGSPTGSPQQTPTSNEESSLSDPGDFDTVSTGQMENQHSSPVNQTVSDNDDVTPSVTETAVKAVLPDNWPPVTGGNSCNQQPLDLSNTVKRQEDVALANAVLDLSLQKKSLCESETMSNSGSQAFSNEAEQKAAMEKSLIKIGDQNISLANSEAPLVTDFTIVTGSNIVTPVEPVADGLVYGLTLPHSSLTPSSASLTPVALQPASPCTIAFASPASHTMLPTAPSLITVLAPPPPISTASSQPIQVLGPNITTEPLVICTENALNSSESDLTPTFATTNSANLITLSQPLDPTLNLPGHVFLTDQIMVVNHIEQQQIVSVPSAQTVEPTILVSSIAESVTLSTSTSVVSDCPPLGESNSDPEPSVGTGPPTTKPEEATDSSVSAPEISSEPAPSPEKVHEDDDPENDVQEQTFTKNFICNVCDKLFHSMKELSHHVADHADDWPYKCEFCVLLFGKPSALLDHRSSLHGVGKTYVCSACTKEFVYLCNLKQHQEELHPGQQCTHTEEEKGKLRPQNYNNSAKVSTDASGPEAQEELKKLVKKEEGEVDVGSEELFTTIKVMASDGGKIKGPDVRLGINQHYPSFKPPPFPYHNRSPAGSLASATNFTTHNIPQTFSTAIRCTKCGKSFDNMPELHKHILACANASDKRRYTPRKNPIPLRHFAKSQNGVLSTTNSTNGLNASNRVSQSNRSKPSQEPPVKFKVLNKRKKKFAQRVMPQRNKSVNSSNKMSPAQVGEQQELFVCPHCSREFTMRRSRTKHMAVCPKKPKEVKKRKECGISVTKENDGHLHRVVPHGEEQQQGSPPHKTRLQTSASAKRPAILPVQTVFSSKRSKIIIKESTQPKQETPTLNELPIVRTFNPSMRQYSRVQHSVKGVPIKITIVKPRQTAPQKDELPPTQRREEATGSITSSAKQSASA
uniref:PR domain containing 2, with ZNF domain a n=1 Tax=Oreochromis niloticus TaxID=8128 RepID=I3J1F7_ORENI